MKELLYMPIYEYECLKCGQRFDLRRHIADSDSNIRCPKCGAEKPQRDLPPENWSKSNATF
jgi:putative FmdB family regulatory protein